MMTNVGAVAASGEAVQTTERAGFATLTAGAIGVVYGDIGTSPLYAFRESLAAVATGTTITNGMVLGVVSLMIWALIIVVTIKYVLFIMRVDNSGEGGTLALMAVLQRSVGRGTGFVVGLGMAGAALFYGDAIITPAISVLSAVEGLKLLSPHLDQFVLPLSLAIMVVLFMVQHRGTAVVATWFGPIISLWFVAMAVGGGVHVIADGTILAAFNPVYGVHFLLNHGHAGLVTLGAVFLTVTGAEALYADMGHFGRRPIQLAWIVFVFPCLVLNYLGQGALLLGDPAALENPFFRLYPEWALLPMVVLATIATIIASQAVITGAFSLTRQAIQLGLLPRMEIRRTSITEKGQIYIPKVNSYLLVAVVAVVLIFRNSGALGAAYGIAVTGTMVITTTMIFLVLWKRWHWPLPIASLVIFPFLLIDGVFLGANTLKVFEGGWLPLVVAISLMVVMTSWRKGTALLAAKAAREDIALDEFLNQLGKRMPGRVPGMAVFLTGTPDSTPGALLHNLKHNKVLHEENAVVSVLVGDQPRIPPAERYQIKRLAAGFWLIKLQFGFMEQPDIAGALAAIGEHGPDFSEMRTSYFLSRRALRPAALSSMPRWQDELFIRLSRSANDASQYFSIPNSRVVEIGTQLTI